MQCLSWVLGTLTLGYEDCVWARYAVSVLVSGMVANVQLWKPSFSQEAQQLWFQWGSFFVWFGDGKLWQERRNAGHRILRVLKHGSSFWWTREAVQDLLRVRSGLHAYLTSCQSLVLPFSCIWFESNHEVAYSEVWLKPWRNSTWANIRGK